MSGKGHLGFDFGHIKFVMSLKHLRRMTWGQIDSWFWSSHGMSGYRCRCGCYHHINALKI